MTKAHSFKLLLKNQEIKKIRNNQGSRLLEEFNHEKYKF